MKWNEKDRNGKKRNGVEWNGKDRNETERNRTEWNGMERNGTQWKGTEFDKATERNATGSSAHLPEVLEMRFPSI